MGKKSASELIAQATANLTNAERQLLKTLLDQASALIELNAFDLARQALIQAAAVNDGNFDEAPKLHARLHAVRAFYLACGGGNLPFALKDEMAAAAALDAGNALLKRVEAILKST